tara:strand:+ start:430 stop:726 length:297 start_codon:yes stop_codon:yes gene_type:complete
MGDVYREMMAIYDKCNESSKIGTSLYHYSSYFVDTNRLADNKYQSRIKEFRFCKTFNIPPYPSIEQTPADVIDDYLIIDEEIGEFSRQKQSEQQKENK